MADDRMFLVHVETGMAVGIAKRDGKWWPAQDLAANLEAFFTKLGPASADELQIRCESEADFDYGAMDVVRASRPVYAIGQAEPVGYVRGKA